MKTEHASAAELAHIPGMKGYPYIGVAPEFIRDPYGLGQRCVDQHGEIFRHYMLGIWTVSLVGADAVEMVLTDRGNNFSSAHGWRLLHRLFPRGLMLRDFEDHRAHRRVMQPAFRASAMRDYLTQMNAGVAELIGDWDQRQDFRFYPAIKDLTLSLGAAVFMGLPLAGDDAKALNKAFADEVAASLALIRVALPGTLTKRGVDGRKFLTQRFAELIPERRANPGPDFFSQLVAAKDDDGSSWSEGEIVDHLNFLMMAAHDTTTSALTTMVDALADNPDWQAQVRAEIANIGGDQLDYEDAHKMVVTERAFKEALRLMPPVPFIPRRTERAFEWKGVHIPKHTHIGISPGAVMMSDDYWTDPTTFDPDRFSPERAEDRSHKYAWAPFGGGAHKCIGLHFAMLQAKAFAFQFFKTYEVKRNGAGRSDWALVPIPRPKDGLPLVLNRL